MKRWTAALLLTALLTGLTACSRTELPPQTTEAPTAVAETTVPATEAATQPTEPALQEPREDSFVRVLDYLPRAKQQLAYAGEDNFTGQVIYDFSDAYLRYGTVKKLAMAAAELEQMGYSLLIWDGFRPVGAQQALWEACPDPNYVSDPASGASSHSRGNTVDLTLVDGEGKTVEMPTGFDDFTAQADRDYTDCTEAAAANAARLEQVMEKHGFTGYSKEWWHFTDTQEYPVEESFQPMEPEWYYARCEEFLTLRAEPDTQARAVTTIPVNGEFLVLARQGDFYLADYQGQQGYVLSSYTGQARLTGYAFPESWEANCEEFISLRTRPSTAAERIDKIPVGGKFQLLEWDGKFARIRYKDQEGYVLSSYIWPEMPRWSTYILKTVPLTATYSYDQMNRDMDAMVKKYPELVDKAAIGTSEQGRDIPVLRIGSVEAEHHVLLQGAIHGREHMTAWLLMAMADYWLENGIEALGDICFHIIPMSNPDGVVFSQSGKMTETIGWIYASDRELGYTTLEAEDYAALWKANGNGVDLNRNFSAGWEVLEERDAPSSELYKGEAPFSAAETQALRDYTYAWDFDATLSYHASGSIIYYEFGEQEPVNSRSRSLGEAVEAVTGYPLTGSADVTGGGYKDWAMEELGIPSLTIEIGCGDAPLESRELYSVFSRNCGVFQAIARWLLGQ